MDRFGTPVPGETYWRRPGAYAVIQRADGLLAIVEMHGRYFHLPGGGIDDGEEPMAALRREVLEETGLDVSPGALIAEVEEYAYAAELGHFVKAGRYHRAALLGVVSPPQEAGHRLLWMTPEQALGCLVHPGQRWVVSQATGTPETR